MHLYRVIQKGSAKHTSIGRKWWVKEDLLLWVQKGYLADIAKVLAVEQITFKGNEYELCLHSTNPYHITCMKMHSTLTFQSLAVCLRTTRFNMQQFDMVLALRWVLCTDLRTNSDCCFTQHKLIGFYNRGGKCLQRGTDWFLIQSRLRWVYKGLNNSCIQIFLDGVWSCL
jgi:hypothetical protein